MKACEKCGRVARRGFTKHGERLVDDGHKPNRILWQCAPGYGCTAGRAGENIILDRTSRG